MSTTDLVETWYNTGVIILFLVAAGLLLIILIIMFDGSFHDVIDIPGDKNIWINRKKFRAPRDHFKIKEKWRE